MRRVPAGWEHPKDGAGNWIPLYDAHYEADARDWDAGLAAWLGGAHPDQEVFGYPRTVYAYEQWEGRRPSPGQYMPSWRAEDRQHWQMYENVSEGTPLSPPCATEEELARWLADHGADAGGCTATYEQWLATIHSGSAPTLIVVGGRVMNGVQATTERTDP